MTKVALITGIAAKWFLSGQFFLNKGYSVHGLKRRASSFNTQRLDHIKNSSLALHYGDLTDSFSINSLISRIRPDEVYNLGAQSHVAVSFETPEYTANADALGTLRLLEAIRRHDLTHTRFYQASTSELFGLVRESPQSETTPFYPRSPYAVSKLFSYWTTINYREAYGLHASNGILFNHESPRRGPTFVTRKITRGLARLSLDSTAPPLELGNIYSLRDWGHARDYVEAMWLMVQQAKPLDLVIGTGKQVSVKDFINLCADMLNFDIYWTGSGLDEKAYCRKTGLNLVTINPHYFRPAEVSTLLADASKARDTLSWEPKTSLEDLVREMIDYDLNIHPAF